MTRSCVMLRLGENQFWFSLADSAYADNGTKAFTETSVGRLPVTVVPKPFYDPKKQLASS